MPWTEEPGGLQSIGSQRIGHDWVSTPPPPSPPSTPRLHSTPSPTFLNRSSFFSTCYKCINSWRIYHELYLILNFFRHDINLFLTFQGLEGTGNKIIAEGRVNFWVLPSFQAHSACSNSLLLMLPPRQLDSQCSICYLRIDPWINHLSLKVHCPHLVLSLCSLSFFFFLHFTLSKKQGISAKEVWEAEITVPLS